MDTDVREFFRQFSPEELEERGILRGKDLFLRV